MTRTVDIKKGFFPFAFGFKSELLPERVLMLPYLPVSVIEKNRHIRDKRAGRLYRTIFLEGGQNAAAIVITGMGGALSGDCVLALAEAGAREVIFAGSCGGLPPCGIGDIIVCSSAVDGEGFSRYHRSGTSTGYTVREGISHKPDSTLTDIIYKRMMSIAGDDTGVHRGGVFTTGSLLSETAFNIKSLTDEGLLGIDMETSAVFCAAQSFGIKAVSVMTVSDLPLSIPFWEKVDKKNAKEYGHTFETVLLNLIEIAENLT